MFRKHKKYDGPTVLLPDAGTITPTLQGQLLLSKKISKQAQRATALLALKRSSPISLGQLYDNNRTVILDKNKMVAIKEDEIILQGIRNCLDGLWVIPILKSRLQSDNYNDPTLHCFQ